MKNWLKLFLAMLMVFSLSAPAAAQDNPDGFHFAGPSDWYAKALVTLSATTGGGDTAAGSGMAMTYGPIGKWRDFLELGVFHGGIGGSDGVDSRNKAVYNGGGGACVSLFGLKRIGCLNYDRDFRNKENRVMLMLTPEITFLE